MEELKTFSEDSVCPKCGGSELGSTYRKDSEDFACSDHRVHQPYTTDEHIDRGCRRCSFRWREEVLIKREE